MTVTGDGEDPGSETILGAREASEASGNLEPRLRTEILGGARRRHSKVAEHGGVEVTEQPSKRSLVASPGPSQEAGELFRQHLQVMLAICTPRITGELPRQNDPRIPQLL